MQKKIILSITLVLILIISSVFAFISPMATYTEKTEKSENNTNKSEVKTTFNTLKIGETYEYGDYIYTYEKNGWTVETKDKNKSSYGEILKSIKGAKIFSLECTFKNCTKLTRAPTIPNGVKIMCKTFENCTALTKAPTIPDTVVNMNGAFAGCTSLTKAPNIPNSVKSMASTFYNCNSLTGTPTIPSGVLSIIHVFKYCTSLKTVIIDTNPIQYFGCFYKSGITTVKGKTTMIEDFLYTKDVDDRSL